jgi:methylmalonyl-CoA/ethylmalonyl-CoA epimerase
MNFHHIGVACHDLEAETRWFAALGYHPEGHDFTDPVQGISGRFLIGGGPRLELLTPLSQNGVLAPWLKSGVKLYHLAYESPNIDADLARLRAEGAKVVVAPIPAVAYAGRKIAFLVLRNSLLMELIAR